MKNVMIMGASSGIGLAVAEALAKRGVKVGLAARHTDRLKRLQKMYPGMVNYSSIDVTKPEAVHQIQELADRMGGMDIYLHVSGIGAENTGLEPEEEAGIINTNLCGLARCVSTVYRYFRDHGKKGHIAAVTSVAGTNGIGELSAYSS